MVFPVIQTGALAEDAVPFIAAVRVHGGDATSIYSADDTAQVPVPLRDAGCPLTPEGTNCELFVLPFLSPPQVLPIMKVVDLFGDFGSVLIMRLLAAASFAGGMWLLWQKLVRRRPEAAVPLLLTAFLLTPYVFTSATFGQNSPLMFLSACLGLSQTDRTSRAGGAAAAWVGTVVFKVFPLPLIFVAILRRRWKFVAFSVGLLVLLTIVAAPLTPSGSYGEFLSTSRAITATRVASPWNVSIDAFIHVFYSSWRGTGGAFYAGVVLRLALIGGLCFWKLRDADEDLQWAYAWMALLALHPQIWWHYFELIIPAVALSLAALTGRAWYALPAVALALLPMAVVTDEKSLTIYGPLLIIAAVIAVPFVGRPRSRPIAVSPAVEQMGA